MSVWIVTADCGDYYCGCGVGHLLGVATSAEAAKRIRAEGERAEHSYTGDRWYRSFIGVVVEEIAADEFLHQWGLSLPARAKFRVAA